MAMTETPFTILLVDDNEFVLRALARYLTEEGLRVLEARSGDEALVKVDEFVDLVILDIMMPGLSGTEVLVNLRRSHSDEELPVVMATASSGSEQIVQAFELGANDYITKPLDFPVVLARLKTQLRGRVPRRIRSLETADSRAEIEAGVVLDGKYRLESKIGEGNCAEVYRAVQLKLERPVAVKLLRAGSRRRRANDDSSRREGTGDDTPRREGAGNDTPRWHAADSEMRERFLREGRSTCRIEHPNAVSVLDAGVSASGVPFLVTELLCGRTLAAELSRHGPMSESRCVEILLPICNVLADAHSLGIVHRDIKPQNIYLHQSHVGEVVKVLDFGIAKLIDDAVVQRRPAVAGTGPGTPAYMAPERFSDDVACGSGADIYSLGVMLYKMLTGRLPFVVAGGDMIELALKHQTESPADLRELRPSLSPAMAAAVLQALAKEPDRRPNAEELAAGFGAALGMETIAEGHQLAATSQLDEPEYEALEDTERCIDGLEE